MKKVGDSTAVDTKPTKQPFPLGAMRLSALEKIDSISSTVDSLAEVDELSIDKQSEDSSDSRSKHDLSASGEMYGESVVQQQQQVKVDSTRPKPHAVEETKKKSESGAASEIKNLLATISRTTDNATKKLPRKASAVVKNIKSAHHSSSSVPAAPPTSAVKTPLEIHQSTLHAGDTPRSNFETFHRPLVTESDKAEDTEPKTCHEHSATYLHSIGKCHSHPSLNLLESDPSNEFGLPINPVSEKQPSVASDIPISQSSPEERFFVDEGDDEFPSVNSERHFLPPVTKRPAPPPPVPPPQRPAAPPSKTPRSIQANQTPPPKPVEETVESGKLNVLLGNHSMKLAGGCALALLLLSVTFSSYLFGFLCGLAVGVGLHYGYTVLNTPTKVHSGPPPIPALRDLPPPMVPEYLAEEDPDESGYGTMTTLTTTTTCVQPADDELPCCSAASMSHSSAASISSTYVYKTWMNQIYDYNVDNYHLHRTYSVYITLDGTTLRLQRSKQRISKRVLFNDKPLSTAPTFVSQRICNLLHAKVCLKPDMLVHKRQWSKKYPICIQLHPDFNEFVIPQQPSSSTAASTSSGILSGLRRRTATNPTVSSVTVATMPADEISVASAPVGDELGEDVKESSDIINSMTVYLFTRTSREKEHWFRLFQGASLGKPLTLSVGQLVKMSLPKSTAEATGAAAAGMKKSSSGMTFSTRTATVSLAGEETASTSSITSETATEKDKDSIKPPRPISEALLCAYVRHMAKFMPADFLMKAASVQQWQINYITCEPAYLWLNALLGRLLWDFLREPYWTQVVKKKIQAKLNKLHLPYFIDGINLIDVDFGTELPVLRRAHRAYMDAFGLWIDLDVAYAGGFSMTVETKVNPMRLQRALKRQDGELGQEGGADGDSSSSDESDLAVEGDFGRRGSRPNLSAVPITAVAKRSAAEYSDEEDSAESSGSGEGTCTSDEEEQKNKSRKSKGRLLRFVDKLANSPYVAKAMQNKYVKRGMEIVQRTSLVLKVDVEHLSGTLCLNIPPPPTDRVWYAFRTNPQLKLSAKPRVGDRTITLARLVEFIETKMVSELQQVAVYPNMDDVVIPLLLDNHPRFFGHCAR